MSGSASGFEVDLVAERPARKGESFRLEAAFVTAPGIAVVFGPSGAGKSTLLLALLGALAPARGRIVLDRRVLFDASLGIDRPVRERRVGIVFQDALLFPHLDVRANVAFGVRGAGRKHLAEAMLARVDALALARRMPAELSGGERQRVVLARALAARPAALLLDEPFSALDAASREALGEMLVLLQAESGIPFLHVTHDAGEAIRLGSELLLVESGRVVAAGTPAGFFTASGSAATPPLAGGDNLFHGTVREQLESEGYTRVDVGGTVVDVAPLRAAPGARVALRLLAEDVLVALAPVSPTSARNVLSGEVVELRPRGAGVELQVATPIVFRALVTRGAERELGLVRGRRVHLLIKAHAFRRL